MADAADLKSAGEIFVGSSPSPGTITKFDGFRQVPGDFIFYLSICLEQIRVCRRRAISILLQRRHCNSRAASHEYNRNIWIIPLDILVSTDYNNTQS